MKSFKHIKTGIKKLIAEWLLSDFDEWSRSLNNYSYHLVTNKKIKELFPGITLNCNENWMELYDLLEIKIEQVNEREKQKREQEKIKAQENIERKTRESREFLERIYNLGKAQGFDITVEEWMNPKVQTVAKWLKATCTVERKIKKNLVKQETIEIGKFWCHPWNYQACLVVNDDIKTDIDFEQSLEILKARKRELLQTIK